MELSWIQYPHCFTPKTLLVIFCSHKEKTRKTGICGQMRTSLQNRNEQVVAPSPLCISISSKRHNRRIPDTHSGKIVPCNGLALHAYKGASKTTSPLLRNAPNKLKHTASHAKQPSLAPPSETQESAGSRQIKRLHKNSLNSGVYRTNPIAIIVALTRRYSSVGRATDL